MYMGGRVVVGKEMCWDKVWLGENNGSLLGW